MKISAGRASQSCGTQAKAAIRWRATLAAFVMLAGFGHFWLHFSNSGDVDHFGANAADECLLQNSPLATADAVLADPRYIFEFVISAPAFEFRTACTSWLPPVRAPPRS
jgi:hypothetical protein